MRLTNVLFRQHIGFMFKKHWRIQGKRTPLETVSKSELLAKNIIVKDPKSYVENQNKVVKKFERVTLVGPLEKRIEFDETHPDYNSRQCHLYGDGNVLVQGVQQAQVLTKTLVFDEFPDKVTESIENVKLPADVERSMQQSVLVSHLLDAQQQKTAIIKIPDRPAFVTPRNFGITDSRKNLLLATRLLNHCERISGRSVTATRRIINDAMFIAPIEKDGDLIQMELLAETLVTSKKPISPFAMKIKSEEVELPDLFPLKHTISIPKVNIYQKRSVYPIDSTQYGNPHTILLHFSPLDVTNIFETEVTTDQYESRSMLKAFSVAATRAQSLYGMKVKTLEKPIVVQSVQFNGSKIQFGIFQLNTLDLDGNKGTKNYWFRKPEMELYQECCYKEGRPAMTGYNFDVLRYMSVFYNN
ncbi:unnamed protein product [Diamesa hyperborea]